MEGEENTDGEFDRKLLEYIRTHNALHRIPYERIQNYYEMLRDHPKHKYHKQLLTMGKNFIDRCPEVVLQELVSRTLKDYKSFLNEQKQKDYAKFERANHLYEKWVEKSTYKTTPDPMEQYMNSQRSQKEVRQ